MAKADLIDAQRRYDAKISLARAAERAKKYKVAIGHAISAWEDVDGMMRFEKRWGKAEFKSLPCVDIVLRWAPLRLDTSALDSLAVLLKENRRIDRETSDDLAGRLTKAREKLAAVYRLCHHIEGQPACSQDKLREALGGDKKLWRDIAEQLEQMGLLERIPNEGSYLLQFATTLDRTSAAKCCECGTITHAPKREFLGRRECHLCRTQASFVLIAESIPG